MNIATVKKSASISPWRQRVMNSIGEQNSSTLGLIGGLTNNTTSSVQPTMQKPGFYIMLEKESPQKIYEDSDASTYDSFHCKETDICRDSSDTESATSFTTEGIATMEVEYEIASDTVSEALHSNNSSSGTEAEDIFIALAASTLCGSLSCSSDFADTEESDSEDSYDSELSAADYWVCVKCKNKQNNPKYRYCEKCYQIRKNHVPPRPRLRKPRTLEKTKSFTRTQTRSSLSPVSELEESVLQSTDFANLTKAKRINNWLGQCNNKDDKEPWPGSSKFHDEENQRNTYRKRKITCYTNKKSSHLNSAAETSTDEGEWSNVDCSNELSIGNRQNTPSPTNNMQKVNISTNYSSSENKNINTNNVSNSRLLNNDRKRKSSSDKEVMNVGHSKRAKNNFSDNISNVKNDISDNNTDFETDKTLKISGKDSGISSATSSQEPVENDVFTSVCSQETICGEIESKNFESQKTVTKLTGHVSELSPITENKILDQNNLVRSVSSCSGEFVHHSLSATDSMELNRNRILVLDQKEHSLDTNGTMQLNKGEFVGLDQNNIIRKKIDDNSELPRYGNCMMCLSEPKNGVFVHNRFLHLCCCYKCAVKIFNKRKRCPICNCAVKNVMKLFVY